MGQREHDFKAALSEWRSEKAMDKLGETDFLEYGVILFMSDEIFHRLVDCFHYGKISTVESIRKETRWRQDLTDTYGPSLITLIHRFNHKTTPTLPQNEAAREAPALIPSTSSGNARSSKAGKTRCSACKQLGHNSEYFFGRLVKCLTSLLLESNKACPQWKGPKSAQTPLSAIQPVPLPALPPAPYVPFRFSQFSATIPQPPVGIQPVYQNVPIYPFPPITFRPSQLSHDPCPANGSSGAHLSHP